MAKLSLLHHSSTYPSVQTIVRAERVGPRQAAAGAVEVAPALVSEPIDGARDLGMSGQATAPSSRPMGPPGRLRCMDRRSGMPGGGRTKPARDRSRITSGVCRVTRSGARRRSGTAAFEAWNKRRPAVRIALHLYDGRADLASDGKRGGTIRGYSRWTHGRNLTARDSLDPKQGSSDPGHGHAAGDRRLQSE
ncbi:hypothetical protein [Sorangium sp. So ce1335]|uniref:hypothetical protein n=1 Tax=Sorangium sp. So ce1335 TaxID=3133335 RepID=UPI003F643B2B